MRARLALALVPALLLLAGCATLSEEECRGGDWEAIGFHDGAAGRLESFVTRHAEACAELGIRPDVAAWRAGREQGLALYCTPENAYALGRRGIGVAPVCGGYDLRELARAHREGLHIYEIGREMRALERELRAIDLYTMALLDGEMTDEDRLRLRRYRREESYLRSRLRLLELERLRYAGYP